MKVRLEPPEGSGLDVVTFETGLLAIGRHTVPFSDFPDDITASLSRQHARLFVEEDKLYLVDLQSTNGSTINDAPVTGQPVAVQDGDVVGFGSVLSFTVRIEENAGVDQGVRHRRHRLRIFLVPVAAAQGIDAVMVTEFPFLVGRETAPFDSYRNVFPEEVGFLSRRHAFIHVIDSKVYIEDLGSANGCYINGELLEAGPHRLRTGDMIAFGGDFFSYHVSIESQSDSAGSAGQNAAAAASQTNKTVLVSSATSFLDIFCFDEAVKAQVGDGKADSSVPDTSDSGDMKASIGRMRKVIDMIKPQLLNDQGGLKRGYILSVAIMLAMVGSLSVWRIATAERRAVEVACASDLPRECVSRARDYLQTNSDKDLAAMATEAFVKGYIPDWIDAVKRNDVSGAARLRQVAARVGEGLDGVDEILSLMTRIERLERYVQGGDGKARRAIVIDQDEQAIESIAAEWDANQDIDRRLMIRLIETEPEFEELRVRVLKSLRRLRNDKSLYVAAIEAFKRRLKDSLDQDNKHAVEIVDSFARRFPNIRGLARYRHDIETLQAYQRALAEKNILKRLDLVQTFQFETALLRHAALRHSRGLLPPAGVKKVFLQVLKDWRHGRFRAAERRLESIRQAPWKDAAQAELQREKRVADAYRQYRSKPAAGDNGDAVFNLYALLDKRLDSYVIEAIRAELARNREVARNRLRTYLRRARTNWQTYLAKGRISSVDRLAERISKHFRTQSGYLSRAYQFARQVESLHDQVNLPLTADEKSTVADIVREMQLQLRALQNLGSIQQGPLLESKIQMLSIAREDTGGEG